MTGVLMKQRVLAQKQQKKVTGDSVMCSIFDNSQQSKSDDVPGFDDEW